MPKTREPHFISIGHLVALACQLEAAAPKVGNVHRGADFDDVTFYDFLVSGQIVGQVLDQGTERSIGQLTLAAVDATQRVVRSNTNLGIILLVVPIAKAIGSLPVGNALSVSDITQTLSALTDRDSQLVYQAIRNARPSGLGTVAQDDIHSEAPPDLLVAMRSAAPHDLIAQQYCNGFQDVFEFVVPKIIEGQRRYGSLAQAIVIAHLAIIADLGDTLILRKTDAQTEGHARYLAQLAIQAAERDEREDFWERSAELDFWMRSDGRRRNPGTSADLIAAGLAVGLYNQQLELNFQWKTNER